VPIINLFILGLFLAACSPDLRRDPLRIQAPGDSLTIATSAERRGISIVSTFTADGSAVNWYRSLAVTDVDIVSRFSFQDVMETLACPAPRACGSAAEREREALQLYQQWWATQNGAPHEAECTAPRLFGFPYCPRAEQLQSTQDPFRKDAGEGGYVPIGLFNRIDLAAVDGADCGEYRIVFARKSGQTDSSKRVLLNFEAVLPNPQPGRGLAGCKPVAEFWKRLSTIDDAGTRAEKLWRFYFGGALPGFGPVIHADNYSRAGGTAGGHIRTNQFLEGPWILREFHLIRTCPDCRPVFAPARLPQTPFGPLFGKAGLVTAHPATRAFQDWFITQLRPLIQGGLHEFTYAVPGMFTTGQSVSCLPSGTACRDQLVEGNYPKLIDDSMGPPMSFWERIAQATIALGLNLSPNHTVARATVVSCAGCHHFSNGADLGGGLPPWLPSLGFVHVSEQTPVNGAYRLSQTLTGRRYQDPDALLTLRAAKLEAVLALPDAP
jgi:hypothetical protein